MKDIKDIHTLTYLYKSHFDFFVFYTFVQVGRYLPKVPSLCKYFVLEKFYFLVHRNKMMYSTTLEYKI
jgi:hypothetical protein